MWLSNAGTAVIMAVAIALIVSVQTCLLHFDMPNALGLQLTHLVERDSCGMAVAHMP